MIISDILCVCTYYLFVNSVRYFCHLAILLLETEGLVKIDCDQRFQVTFAYRVLVYLLCTAKSAEKNALKNSFTCLLMFRR